jgi:uncharacterized membrane protein
LSPVTSALYGSILFFAAIAYFILQNVIIRSQGKESLLAKAIGGDIKGKASPILYLTGIAVSFGSPFMAEFLYVLVALMWLIPDKRIERVIGTEKT